MVKQELVYLWYTVTTREAMQRFRKDWKKDKHGEGTLVHICVCAFKQHSKNGGTWICANYLKVFMENINFSWLQLAFSIQPDGSLWQEI